MSGDCWRTDDGGGKSWRDDGDGEIGGKLRKEYKSINIEVLQSLAEKNGWSVIDPENLREAGLISKNDLVKILGKGAITAKIEVKAHAFSKTAQAAIESAQGTVVKL